MLALSSSSAVLRTLARASSVEMLAYTLRPGAVAGALAAASRRGASVRVRLEGAPYNDPHGRLARENARMAARLRRSGIEVTLSHVGRDAARDAPLHAKALLADGALFFDDRNWGVHDFIVADNDRADAANVRAVFDARAFAQDGDVAMTKRAALQTEAGALRSATLHDDAIVETESFGRRNPVYAALDELAKAGASPRLLVSKREARGRAEREALDRLSRDGVRVRVCNDSEKFAIVAGSAWIGSANASPDFGSPDTIDWGVKTHEAGIVAAARHRAEINWRSAQPFRPGKESLHTRRMMRTGDSHEA